MSNFKFEDKIDDINDLLSRYRAKWQLNAIAWMDYDDVCQIIRLHFYNKWHLWNQDMPFKPWASMVISNQMKNIGRNNYSNFAKPCLKCPHFLGNDGCGWTKSGVQDEECPAMKKWKAKKEKVYNLKLPLPIEEGIFIGQTHKDDHFDYSSSVDRLHASIMAKLNDKHKIIYEMIYIHGNTDEEIAERFKFKSDPSKRKRTRYKQIANLKKKFYELAAKILEEEDII